MSKIKKDRSKSELGSPNVEGQGTTTSEQGVQSSSANKKQKRSYQK
ncbi:YuzL family protein [Priestia megaterium]